MLRTLRLALLLLVPSGFSIAQAQSDAKPIQDNSFLVEEAYNQNYGVVQHIQFFQRQWISHDWVYAFTQEWPVDPAPRNQLSYTIPMVHFGGVGSSIGDVALNYRYQVLGDGNAALGSSRLLRLVNAGDFPSAAREFLHWNHAAGKVMPGLTRRRQAEATLFAAPVTTATRG